MNRDPIGVPATDPEMAQIYDWFTYHAPTDEQQQLLKLARSKFYDLAMWLASNIDPSRERSIAMTELRKAAMVVNQAIIFQKN